MALIPMFPVATAIDVFADPVTLLVPTAGSYVDGRWVEGTPDTVIIQAKISAISSTDLVNLPEGLRADAQKSIWSRTKLISDPKEGGPYRVEWEGKIWRILYVYERTEGGFYKAHMGLERGDPDRNRE